MELHLTVVGRPSTFHYHISQDEAIRLLKTGDISMYEEQENLEFEGEFDIRYITVK